MNTNYKILSTVVDITQLLHENNCTYNESYKILQMVTNELKQQQENIEYPTVDDYLIIKHIMQIIKLLLH